MSPSRDSRSAQLVPAAFSLPREPLPLLLGTLLLFCSLDLLARSDAVMLWGPCVLLALALRWRAWAYVPAALLLVFLFPASRFYPEWVWKVPAAPFLVSFLLCAVGCAPFPRLRNEFRWIRKGQIDNPTWLLVVLTSLVSAVALILWALWTNYLGYGTEMLAPVKTAPRWFSLLVLVPAFSVVNAAAEEVVYRGVLQEALEAGWSEAPGALLALQASAFAAAHYSGGFPNGKLGYLMVFVYALMLGWLRRRTGGILAPYVAHVCADAVIGLTLVLLVT